jgi:hypothetical protein
MLLKPLKKGATLPPKLVDFKKNPVHSLLVACCIVIKSICVALHVFFKINSS